MIAVRRETRPPPDIGGRIAVALAAALALSGGAASAAAQEAPLAADTGAFELPDPPATALTLDQAIERALAVSPTLAQADASVRSAEAGRLSALGAYLPTVNASTNASRASANRFNPQTNTTVTGSANSYSAGLNAGVDVWNGGRRGAEMNDARATLEAAEATARQRRFDVMLQAETAFYDVLRREELMRVATGRIRRAEQSLAAADRRLQVGTATRSDVLRAQLELNDARQTELTERTAWTVATYALGRVVGVGDRVGAIRSEPATPIRPLALTDEELRAIVETGSPAVITAEADLRSADAGVDVARASYFPSLRASSNLNWFNQELSLDGGRSSWNLGLAMSLPVFNGFQRESAVTRARVAADVARYQVRDARRAVRVDLERLLGALRLAEERVGLTREAVEVAEEDLRVQSERYRLGATTILELLTSQLNLAQAETDAIAAYYDYFIARAELETLVGREL